MKRFIKEYASFTKKEILNDNMYNALIKDIAIMRINKILIVYDNDLISIKECMDCISNAINYAITVYNEQFFK